MEFVGRVKLLSDAGSMVLSNIPQDAEDLVLIISARTNRGDENDYTQLLLNGTVSYEAQRFLWGDSTQVVRNATDNSAIPTTSATGVANGYNNVEVYLSNYRSSVKKVANIQTAYLGSSTSRSGSSMASSIFNLTSAITSITLTPRFGSLFIAGSSASLYKITAGSDGITAVS